MPLDKTQTKETVPSCAYELIEPKSLIMVMLVHDIAHLDEAAKILHDRVHFPSGLPGKQKKYLGLIILPKSALPFMYQAKASELTNLRIIVRVSSLDDLRAYADECEAEIMQHYIYARNHAERLRNEAEAQRNQKRGV